MVQHWWLSGEPDTMVAHIWAQKAGPWHCSWQLHHPLSLPVIAVDKVLQKASIKIFSPGNLDFTCHLVPNISLDLCVLGCSFRVRVKGIHTQSDSYNDQGWCYTLNNTKNFRKWLWHGGSEKALSTPWVRPTAPIIPVGISIPTSIGIRAPDSRLEVRSKKYQNGWSWCASTTSHIHNWE